MAQSQHQHIQTGSVSTSYRMAGDGTCLVFIHAFPFNMQMWDAQFDELSSQAKVLSYDIRGFGGSETGPEKMSIDQMAQDLIALLDALKIDQCVACGLSMGGYILMNAVSRFPERFKGLVFADTQCIADSEEGKQKRKDTISKIENEGLQKFADGFLQNIFAEKTLADKKDVVEKARQMIVSCDQQTVTSALRALAQRSETCNALKKIRIPALVICGREDKVTPLTQSELIHNSIDGAEIKIIEKAGHLSNMEQPEVFNEQLRSFLAKIN